MQRWEYKVVTLRRDEQYTAALNEFGREGWELVSVASETVDAAMTRAAWAVCSADASAIVAASSARFAASDVATAAAAAWAAASIATFAAVRPRLATAAARSASRHW